MPASSMSTAAQVDRLQDSLAAAIVALEMLALETEDAALLLWSADAADAEQVLWDAPTQLDLLAARSRVIATALRSDLRRTLGHG